jgi:hypothetical protein
MARPPVTEERIQIAKEFGLHNVEPAALACRNAEPRLPFWAACALLQKESGGRNVYGRDVGGALSGFPHPVSRGNWEVFRWLVFDKGHVPNGVGPCQITYAGPLLGGKRDGGYFRQMEERHLRPWVPLDNMLFGFGLLAAHQERLGSWARAGRAYNGSSAYGADLVEKINQWRERLHIKGGPVS